MIDFDDGARAYLNFVLEHLHTTPSALAKRASVASPTLPRVLNDKNHKFRLSTTTIDKIARSTNLNPGPFLDSGNNKELRSVWHARPTEDVLQFAVAEYQSAIGVWKDKEFLDKDELSSDWWVPPPHVDNTRFYVQVNDKSCDLIASKGDFVYCFRGDEEISPWHPGEKLPVFLERKSDIGQTIEQAFWGARVVGEDLELTVLSDAPRYRDHKHIITRAAYDAGQILVLGVAVSVVHSLRPWPGRPSVALMR